VDVSREILSKITEIYIKYFSTSNGMNNFTDKDIREVIKKRDPNYNAFSLATCELQMVDLISTTQEDRIAFFLNIYATLVLHASMETGTLPVKSYQWYSFSKQARYIIQGYNYSLLEIEHGILRRCGAPPNIPFAKAFLSDAVILPNDPRFSTLIYQPVPYVSFALYYNVASGPPLRIFSSDNIYQELQESAKIYVQDNLEIRSNGQTVRLPKILDWYATDLNIDIDKPSSIINALEKILEQKLDLVTQHPKVAFIFKKFSWKPQFLIAKGEIEKMGEYFQSV